MKKKLVKMLSLFIAVVLSISAVFAAMPLSSYNVSAQTQWFIPSMSNGLIPAANLSSWWSSLFKCQDIADGAGVHFEFINTNAVGVRQAFNTPFDLDGLTLKLENIENANKTATFSILLQDCADNMLDPNNPNSGVLALIAVDTVDGEIRFENDGIKTSGTTKRYHNDGTVLLKDDRIKYDNVSNKEFLISFHKKSNGDFDVKATVNGEEITGSTPLSAGMIASVTKLSDLNSVYVGIAAGRDNSGTTKLDFKAIGYNDTSSDEGGLDTKVEIAKKELTVSDVVGTNFWPSLLRTQNSATGGIKFSFTNSFRNIRMGINDAAALDGMYLKLNKITSVNNSFPRILFVFSATKQAETQDGMFSLLLDTKSGKLKVIRDRHLLSQTGRATDAQYLQYEDTIITDNRLKYDHIKGKVVIIRTFANADGSYDLTVKIGDDNELTGKITAEIMAKSTAFSANQNMYLTLHAGVCQDMTADFANMSVDVVEFWSLNFNYQDVIEEIEKIGEVSLDSGAVIRNAREMYEQLIAGEKDKVTNIDKLTEAENKYNQLIAEADKLLTFMSKSNSRIHGSTNAEVLATLASWQTNFNFNAEDIPTGGMRLNFSGTSRNVRDGYAGTANFNALFIQFDNLDANVADKAKFAVMFGNGGGYGVEYSPERGNSPLTLVLDPSAGTVTAYPKNTVLIQDDALKLENLAGKRFSYIIESAINESYNFTVAVPGKELTAVIDNTIFSEATINDTGAVDIMVTPWESNSIFSLDFIGFKQTRLGASDIVALIDSIGLVNLDSKEKIDTALEAFEKLPGFEQEQVSNYDALLYMYNFCSSLEYNYMIYEAQDSIDAIGTVGYGSAAAIRTAEFAVARLTDEQKAKVSNLDVFMKAKSKFYELTKDKMEFESYANPFSLRFNFEGQGDLWNKSSSEKLANNGYRFNFVEAIRDVRNGSPLGIPLDGLFMRLANLTAEEGSNGEGTKLSIQIGSTDTSYRGGDITCAAMALVLDTYEGALYAYPGRHLLIEDKALKQSNIENKEFSVRFDITPEKLYMLTLKIEKQELSAIMPPSLMYNENIALRTDYVTVALTPWVNTYNGTTDSSKHTFSVDF